MRVLVCGGRKFTRMMYLYEVLDNLHQGKRITFLAQGGARGADRLAKNWARIRKVKGETWYADWDKFGKGAGPVRNGVMLCEAEPDIIVAFKGGSGTANMIAQAEADGFLFHVCDSHMVGERP